MAVDKEMLRIIEREYEEMPGMRLTEAQFRRLWALAPSDCEEVTAALLQSGVLSRDADGRYCRRDDLIGN
jgi:hypothetical protein